ncbi:MAG: GNAT family N-acetyltransferase [Actinomycetota bacterium]|nr:GNAT family N-acetyltransferase [Actinomycetota bacterium]
MTFLYFAYGSNLWPPQMRGRCPSARPVGTASLDGWAPVYDKPSRDGSAKLSIRERHGAVAQGVIYEIADDERTSLDSAEHLYDPLTATVNTDAGERLEVVTYRWSGAPSPALPYDWYVAMAQAGAAHHRLSKAYYSNHLSSEADDDPLAPGIRPATADDLPMMQDILSEAIATEGSRYTIHPGDLAWWMFHADPRYADQLSFWVQGETGVLVIYTKGSEISAFARPGVPVVPMIEWAQRRMGGVGEVGWVSDEDTELVAYLESEGYEPVATDRSYRWDLTTSALATNVGGRGTRDIPKPDLPPGWELRHLLGEHEADNRRRASHAAFRSKMDGAMHLDRYLGFMRSPVYEPRRDLVAVAPDGRVAAFMVWWPDVSGIAQIEPFGTHPDFQRQGIGRALIHFGLGEMAEAGMRVARVGTNDWREDATGFYRGVGFVEDGLVRWWGH